jgi:osmotically-inducible protein OsmY
MNTTHSKYAARSALALAIAALAVPLAATAANDPSSPSSPSATPTQGSTSQGSSTKQKNKTGVSKRAKTGSDQQIADRVATALSNDNSMDGAAIIVVVDDGQVALDGTTADASQSAHAMQVAQDAAGPAVIVVDDLQPAALVIAPAPATR